MKSFFRKMARVKKRQAIKKAIVAGAVGYALKYGAINANADLFINSRQETQSTNNQKIETVHDDSQSLTETGLNNCNCTKVKTGSGTVLAFSKDIPAEAVVPETILVKNNSSSLTTVPGVARGFSTQPRVNPPAGAGRVNPGRPIQTPQFRTPHGIVKNPPVTGGRPKQTKLGASKARQNSQPTKGKGSPKPGGSTPTEIDDTNPSVKAENQEQQQYDFVKKKNKNKSAEQCELDENVQDAPHKINEKFESKAVKKLVKKALNNQDVKKEYDRIKKRIEEGVNPINIGPNTAAVAKDKVLIKEAHGRYLVEVSGNQVNVFGICSRGNKKNVNSFERLMNEMYDVNLQY